MAEEELRSLITDEHRAEIGKKSDPVAITVTEADAKRMRDLLEDKDPRWADGTGNAPPYIIAAFGSGRPRRGVQVLPAGLMTTQEWQFTRPFKIGEELQAVTSVVDIRDRLGGRYGYSVLVTHETEYLDKDGNRVGATIATFTQFDPQQQRKGDE